MNDLNVDYVTYAVAIPGLCQESAAGHKWLTKVFDPGDAAMYLLE